jgi:hypothetical protein
MQLTAWLTANSSTACHAVPQPRSFGANVRAARRFAGLGRVALAEQAGLNPLYLTLLEHGLIAPLCIPPRVVGQLSAALSISPDTWPVLPWPAGDHVESTVEAGARRARIRTGVRFFADLATALQPVTPRRDAATDYVHDLSGDSASRIALPAVAFASLRWHLVDVAVVQSRPLAGEPAPPGSLTLRVVDRLTGAPVPHAILGVRAGPHSSLARSDTDGQVIVTCLRAPELDMLELFTR